VPVLVSAMSWPEEGNALVALTLVMVPEPVKVLTFAVSEVVTMTGDGLELSGL
jgi:hypothetical protein